MKVVIVGGTAGLGRALAEETATRGHSVLLAGGDERDLAALTAHLRLAFGVQAEYVACRLGSPDADCRRAILDTVQWYGPVDAILLPIGLASDSDTGLLDGHASRRLLEVNFLGQVDLISALWPQLSSRPRSYIVGFGSVAALRGRSRNVIYAAAKRALLSYFESLRHMAADMSMRVHFYELGYVETQQTFGKKLLFAKVPARQVAQFVLNRLDRKEGAVTYPRQWLFIGLVLKWMPWFIYKRLRF